MRKEKNRIKTIIALIQTSDIAVNGACNAIISEFNEVSSVSKVNPNTRRNLLRIIHSTRGLDTCLRIFLDHYNIRQNANTIGQYLVKLQNHENPNLNKLPNNVRQRFQTSIVDVRNQYMHSAGKIANNESEVNLLISEMEACVSIVLNLD